MGTCLIWGLLWIPPHAQAQCDFIKRDIESVRNNAIVVLKLSDTLEVFVSTVERTRQYSAARSNTRKAQIYSGEILAAAYRAVAATTEAQQRAEDCGISGVEGSLISAASYASEAREFADQAFAYAKQAYASRNLETIQNYLQKSLAATRESQKAARLLAYEASEAHFCATPQAVVAAGKG